MEYKEEDLRKLLKSALGNATGDAILRSARHGNTVMIRMKNGRVLVLDDDLVARLALQVHFGWIPTGPAGSGHSSRPSSAPP